MMDDGCGSNAVGHLSLKTQELHPYQTNVKILRFKMIKIKISLENCLMDEFIKEAYIPRCLHPKMPTLYVMIY